jgi:thioesterase domain-containing protein
MFGPQRAAFPHLEVPAWLDPSPGETLASYGHRFADVIGPRGPLVIGGASFGGMVALEAARWLQPAPSC